MTLNIGNPSLQRVRKQIDWIEHRDEDIFVLTETKVSEGCSFLEEYFGEQGQTLFDYGKEAQFNVFFPKSSTGDLGVMLLSRFPILSQQNLYEILDLLKQLMGREFQFHRPHHVVCFTFSMTKIRIS